MTDPDKKPKAAFNKNADNYIRSPDDVARALAAVQKRRTSLHDQQKQKEADAQAQLFAQYTRNLQPMFAILENLPRDKNNMEFFIRRDLAPDKQAEDGTKGAHINIWLIYGRQRTAPASTSTPETHAVTFDRKDKDKIPGEIEKSPARMRVALGIKPVLHITVTPTKAGDHIESTLYQERYVRDNGTARTAAHRGDFIEQPDIRRQEKHPHLRDATRVIYDWIKETAPERTEEIRKALAVLESPVLQDDVKVSRPLTLKKHPPRSPKGG